jgi:hypothetical protein
MAMRQDWCATEEAALFPEGEGEPLSFEGREEETGMDDRIRAKENRRLRSSEGDCVIARPDPV